MSNRPLSRSALARHLAGIACLCLCTSGGWAQEAAKLPPPQLVVSGSGEVLVPATLARFTIGVTTSAATAAAAGENNARVTKAVREALQAAHLRPADLTGSRLLVSPHWDYDQTTRRSKRSAFDATNSLEVETEALDQVGIYIDAALSAGATDISQIGFAAKDTAAARRQALSEAVAAARTDAETLAKAGGGRVGPLLSISAEPLNAPAGVALQEMAVSAARRAPEPVTTDVVPGQIRVTARIDARWQFIPAAAGQ